MSKSFIGNVFQKMIEGRERQAQKYFNAHLQSYSEEELKSFGTSHAQIKREGVSFSSF